jgi:hypothetical protein
VRAKLGLLKRDLQLGLHHQVLDAPRPKDGFKHRWIRLEILGQDDSKNVSNKLRSGFELVRADEYPR